jgi:hypothetical protein
VLPLEPVRLGDVNLVDERRSEEDREIADSMTEV